jgi:hypothetical protein
MALLPRFLGSILCLQEQDAASSGHRVALLQLARAVCVMSR